jgi:hypothetical protein
MIIKNISGETRYFGFGTKARGRMLANNATATLSDDQPSVLAAVQHFVQQGVLQIVSGPTESQILGGGTIPASGYILVNGTVSDNDTVTIAEEVFKFANAPTGPVLGKYYDSLSARWAGDGAAAATAAGTLVTAINNVSSLNVSASPAKLYDTGVYVVPLHAKNGTMDRTGLTLDASGTNLDKSGTIFSGGANQAARRTLLIKRTITADEESGKLIVIATGLPSISFFLAQLRTAAGDSKTWTGTIADSGGSLVISSVGASAWAETDVLQIMACE